MPEIRKAGFDAKEQAKEMEAFYRTGKETAMEQVKPRLLLVVPMPASGWLRSGSACGQRGF